MMIHESSPLLTTVSVLRPRYADVPVCRLRNQFLPFGYEAFRHLSSYFMFPKRVHSLSHSSFLQENKTKILNGKYQTFSPCSVSMFKLLLQSDLIGWRHVQALLYNFPKDGAVYFCSCGLRTSQCWTSYFAEALRDYLQHYFLFFCCFSLQTSGGCEWWIN